MKRAVEAFHAARWGEPSIFDLHADGERGIVPPPVEPEIRSAVPDPLAAVPAALRRQRPPALPEVSQARVLRHYVRLSQMCMGVDATPDMMGTCTMKYSPKVNEDLVRSPKVTELHPLQDDETVQGMLEVFHRFERMLCEISGLSRFTLQPAGGSQGVYANASERPATSDGGILWTLPSGGPGSPQPAHGPQPANATPRRPPRYRFCGRHR